MWNSQLWNSQWNIVWNIIRKNKCSYTVWKVSKYGVFSGPYFLVLELNTEIYSLDLRIQSKCGKLRTRKNTVYGHFSRSEKLI